MATVTEEQVKQTAEQQAPQLSDFVIKPKRGGPTTLDKDDTTLEVARDGAVTLNDTGRGVQVKRTDAPAPEKPNPAIIFEDDDEQIITTLGATVTAPLDGPAKVATNGKVILVKPVTFGEVHRSIIRGDYKPPSEETGLQLSFTADGVKGKLDGTEFGIGKNNVAVDASRIELKPAAEASADETDIQLGLSRLFNLAVIEGLNAKVRIDLDKKGRTVVYTNGKLISMTASANTPVNGAAVEADENMIRLTLAGGKVFDVDTSNGNVRTYTTPDDSFVKKGSDEELAAEIPLYAAFTVTLGQDGKRVGMNGSGLERTAEGDLVAATDGTSRLKSFAAAPAPAPTEAELASAANAYKGGWYDTGIPSPIYPDMIMRVALEDLPGTPTLDQAEQVAEDTRRQGMPTVHVAHTQEMATLRREFNRRTFKKNPPCAPLNEKPPGYWTSDVRRSGVGSSYQHPVTFDARDGSTEEGYTPPERYARLVGYRPAKP